LFCFITRIIFDEQHKSLIIFTMAGNSQIIQNFTKRSNQTLPDFLPNTHYTYS